MNDCVYLSVKEISVRCHTSTYLYLLSAITYYTKLRDYFVYFCQKFKSLIFCKLFELTYLFDRTYENIFEFLWNLLKKNFLKRF
jgi:hypothetical protein